MITSKHIRKIVAAMVCLCIITCGFIVYAANAFDTTRIPEYQRRMFGDDVITIDIRVDTSEWQNLLNSAIEKEWISGDMIINGQRFSAVGIRTKGNSSLSQTGSSGRYSLQFKANRYLKGQTFFGLDTFCVNNMMGDATYMKDYISYDIMNFIGVDTPLVNYAKVTVNGEDYGFGIALERYDKAFLDRVYSTAAGQLYNVKIGMGRRGDFEDLWQDVANAQPGGRWQGGMDVTNRDFDGLNRGGGIGMGGFGGGGGGSLIYTNDDISSYSAIFDNAVFSNVSDSDKRSVITALENLSAGTSLEEYFDVDATLRYFAAHTVVVNLDSYTSNMQQNYYLYERDGRLTILPWDYNLAFGGFMSGNASSAVNFPIDTPVSGVSMEDRPLLNVLLSVDEYRERYHEYLQQIVEGYFESGLFERTVNELDVRINDFVRDDVNTFHTYDQYKASLPVFIEFGRLRAESIRGQLEGTIPSTSSGQNADSSSLVDASNINLSALGSMMGGGGMDRGGWQGADAGQGWERQGEIPGGQDWAFPDGQDWTFPEGQDRTFPSGGMGRGDRVPGMGGLNPPSGGNNDGGGQGNQPDRNPGNMPGVTAPGTNGAATMPGAPSADTSTGYIIATAVSLILLAGAIIFVAKPGKNAI